MTSEEYEQLLTDPGEAGIFVRPEDAQTLDAAAERAGLARWTVDIAGVRTKDELLGRLAERLGFPDWFGRNWDALNDVLGEQAWEQPRGIVLTLEHCGDLAAADAETFETALEVLDSVAESCYDEDIPFWVLVDGVDAKAFDLPVMGRNED
ncbi:MAG: barstar family protein [Burkholderiales bacterium]